MKAVRHIINENDLFRIIGDEVLDKKIAITRLNFENVWFDELRFSMISYGEIIESGPTCCDVLISCLCQKLCRASTECVLNYLLL
jgi:hypothetical protein